MNTIFRVAFYLRSNFVNRQGKSPVMIRLYLNNERITLVHLEYLFLISHGTQKT
jgi:hypothetical protein